MRLLRWILGLGAVVVVLAVLAIAAGAMRLNTFIHSESFRHEIEARAGRSLGGTVQIETIHFDLFNGVELRGLFYQTQGFVYKTDPGHVDGRGALQVNVQKVDCTYAWKELFHRRLKLTGVTLDRPQIILTPQSAPPLVPPETAPVTLATPGALTAPLPPVPPPAAVPVVPPPTQAPPPGLAALPFQFVLNRAKLNDGSISVRDAAGAPMVELQGVDADANTSGYYDGGDITGTLHVAQLVLPSNLQITDFSTPVTFHAGGFEAKPFGASALGGRLAGGYQSGNSGISILDLNAKGFDVAQLAAAIVSNSTAKVSGSLDLQSKWRSVESGVLDGEGDAQLVDGKIEGVKILQDLSQILRLKELDSPVITRAQTHFLVQNRQAKFIGLQLDSPIFRITGDGTAGFDGGVNANLVLILTRDAMAQLPKEAAASFVSQQDGTGSIAFRVYGTMSHPETDLGTRLLMQNTQIQNVIDKALKKFFH